jgi:hypothetical protein
MILHRTDSASSRKKEADRFLSFLQKNLFSLVCDNNDCDPLEVDVIEVYLQPLADQNGNRELIVNASVSVASSEEPPRLPCETVDLDDYRFHLRNALVLVSTKSPEAQVAIEVEEKNPVAPELPTAVRIVVEEPEVDFKGYGLMAIRIQRMLRRWRKWRLSTVKIIQSCYKTYLMLCRWRKVVYNIIRIANSSCVLIQKVVRSRSSRLYVNTVIRSSVLRHLLGARSALMDLQVDRMLQNQLHLSDEINMKFPALRIALNFQRIDEAASESEQSFAGNLIPDSFWGSHALKVVGSQSSLPNAVQLLFPSAVVGGRGNLFQDTKSNIDPSVLFGDLDMTLLPNAEEPQICAGTSRSDKLFLPPLYRRIIDREMYSER